MKWARALALASLLTMPGALFGLGVGTLERHSGLNEDFDATIALLSNDPNELETLKINLASDAEFERAGVQRVQVLSLLQFKVVETTAGAGYVRVTSSVPVREPFLNFLIEVNWERGRIIREYTVLLDPPLYSPTRQLAVQDTTSKLPAHRPVTEPTSAVLQSIDTDRETYGQTSGGVEPGTYIDEQNDITPAPFARNDEFIPGVHRATERGDTLWSIAQVVRADSNISTQQMMLAMLRANPEAFSQDNVNTLKRGYVLRVPEREEIAALTQSDALQEIAQHHALWGEYRRLSTVTTVPEPIGVPSVNSKLEADTDVELSDEDQIEEARLKLVSLTDDVFGEDESVTSSEMEGVVLDGLRRELALANERLMVSASGNTELRNQLIESEALVGDLSRMIELREAELAAVQEVLAAKLDEEPVVEEPSTEELEVPVQKSIVVEEADPEKVDLPPGAQQLIAKVNTMFGRVIPESVLAIVPGGALTILAIPLLTIVGLGFMGMKILRGGGEESATVEPESFEDITDTASSVDFEEDVEWELPQESGPTATSDLSSTQPPVLEQSAISEIDAPGAKTQFTAPELEQPAAVDTTLLIPVPDLEDDPLAEVNVYLAYERFDRAEELVTTAIKNEPDNHSFKLRLLEVFYSSNNKTSYEECARELNDAVGGKGDLWNSALAMWQEMSPNRALFEVGTDVEAVSADTYAANASELSIDDEDAMGLFPDSVAASADDLDSVLDDTLSVDLNDSASNVDVSLDDLLLELEDDATAEERVADSGPDLSLETEEDAGLELASADDGDFGDFSPQLEIQDDDEQNEDTETIGTRVLEHFDASNRLETVMMDSDRLREGLDEQNDVDDVDTRLNLAKAYIELGDKQGAEAILDEVANECTDAQQQEVAELRSQLD